MRKPVIAGIMLLAACAVLGAVLRIHVLTLRGGDRMISLHVVDPGDAFLLKYLHSVSLSDVWEKFVIDTEHRIVLTETRFKGQGAGLPTSLSGTEKLVREADWFRITGMRRRVPFLDWRIQKEWEDRFRFGDEEELNLSHRFGDMLIRIAVEKMKPVTWLFYRLTAV